MCDSRLQVVQALLIWDDEYDILDIALSLFTGEVGDLGVDIDSTFKNIYIYSDIMKQKHCVSDNL